MGELDALAASMKDASAYKFTTSLGPVFKPRFFCCTDPNTLGIADGKEPVALIDLDPNPTTTNSDVDYTGTASYDPDGSITGYAWTFESHTPASGTVSAGTLNYDTAGTYTITLTVTDGTGLKSTPASTELVVLDPTIKAYVATSSGVFYSDGSAPLSWDGKNSGLSGDDLKANFVVIDPATQQLAENKKTVWRATDGGIQVSNDGGASWAEKVPGTVTNAWSDGTAPTVADLKFTWLDFATSRLFAIATWQNAGGDERSWIFYTTDHPDMRTDTSGTVTWTEL